MRQSCVIGLNRTRDCLRPWAHVSRLTLFGILVLIPHIAFSQVVRPAWTTSRISGSPEPAPPLQTVQKFSALKFDRPLLIRTDSAALRLWVVEQGGAIHSFPDDSNVTAASLFVDFQKSFAQLTPYPDASGFGSAYGLAFHPQYPQVPVCWITYTLNSAKQNHLEDGTRLSRFEIVFDEAGVPHCNVASEKVLLTWLEGGHNGACLEFGPDGFLYVSAGDGEAPNPPDPRGISVVRDWIQTLAPNATEPATLTKGSPPAELTSTSQALEWMLALHDNSLAADDRQRLLEAARRAPPEISNLFERFQPVELRRRIRTMIDPGGVLAIAGDASAGRDMFFDKRTQCMVCHRIGTQGGAVGPALDDIGIRQTRAEILASLLEPSKKIDPKFATWVAQTTDGKVRSGLLMSRDGQKIGLRNAKAEDAILNATDVEELQPQAISLMPEKQLNDLSDADIAGLLEFLSQQKSLPLR